tara:strand:- start:300 stop:647 length:348 start_codon:yes stop_codon:yes gene_type:complete
MGINPIRAEKQLVLGDKTYKARVSLDTIKRIESSLGVGLMSVASKLSTGEIMLEQMVSIIYLSIRAGGNDVTENDINSSVNDTIGYVGAIKLTGELLALALDINNEPADQKKTNL